MMVNSYYGIYQAERCKTASETLTADAQLGSLAAALGQLSSAVAARGRAVHQLLRRRRSAIPDAA
jgi:GH24 family phage-related lysozyme (muramidase)